MSDLTPKQLRLKKVKVVTTLGMAIGVLTGCLLGVLGAHMEFVFVLALVITHVGLHRVSVALAFVCLSRVREVGACSSAFPCMSETDKPLVARVYTSCVRPQAPNVARHDQESGRVDAQRLGV